MIPVKGLILLACLCLILPSSAQAGSGNIEDGRLNLSVMFTYYEPNPHGWKPVFDEASKLLYNATNGQLQLGTIRVLNCAYDKDDADIWIRDNNAGAFATVLGLGGEGHIYLSQTHKSTEGASLGQFGIVHELGHYVFGLFDEYKGLLEGTATLAMSDLPGGVASEQDAADPAGWFCTAEADLVACIMDGGSTIVPDNGRTEFCTATHGGLSTAHNDTTHAGGYYFVNAQHYLNEESCWETMAGGMGLIPPEAVDTADPPDLEPIVWELAEDVTRTVLCIDKSRSISGGLFDNVKKAAIQVVDLFHTRRTVEMELLDGSTTSVELPGEELGVVSFAEDVFPEFPIRELVRNSDKNEARFAIGDISLASDTDIGGGLHGALTLILEESSTPSCSESIILLSDGGQNAGMHPEEVIPMLQDRGIKVFAVGIGAAPNVELLQEVAEATGGSYYPGANLDDMNSALAAISAESRSGGRVTREDGQTDGEDWKFPHIGTELTSEMTSLLEWVEGWLDLELRTPSGEIIDLSTAPSRGDVYAIIRAKYILIRVTDPEPGDWLLTVRAVTMPDTGSINFNLTIMEEDEAVRLTTSTDKQAYTYPETVKLRAEVIGGVPVNGALVEATVSRPGAAPVEITLLDDGVAGHGDTFAGDGVYTAFFDDFSSDGIYTFNVRATNETGTSPDPDLPFVEEGSDPTPVPIPPFTRETEVSIVVEGVPLHIQGGLDVYPETINANQEPIWFFGTHIRAWVELPPPYSAGDIDLSTVALNHSISARTWPFIVWDRNGNGILERLAFFDRQDVVNLLGIGVNLPVKVSGSLTSGEAFEVEDSINIIDVPCGEPGEDAASLTIDPPVLRIGSQATLNWDIPDGTQPWTAYTCYVSPDSGVTWSQVFSGFTGGTSYRWNVDIEATPNALAVVEAHSPEGIVRMALSNKFRVAGGHGPREPFVYKTQFLNALPSLTSSRTVLSFSLAQEAKVRLDVFDARGRLVKRLLSGVTPAGIHRISWDGADERGRAAPAGVYFYIFEVESVRKTGKIMIVR
jgi:hypothetical protein